MPQVSPFKWFKDFRRSADVRSDKIGAVEKSEASRLLEEAASCIRKRLDLDYTDSLELFVRYSTNAQNDVRRATLVALLECHRLNNGEGVAKSLAKIQRGGTKLQSLTPPGIADTVQAATSQLIANCLVEHDGAYSEQTTHGREELAPESSGPSLLSAQLRQEVNKQREDMELKELRLGGSMDASGEEASRRRRR